MYEGTNEACEEKKVKGRVAIDFQNFFMNKCPSVPIFYCVFPATYFKTHRYFGHCQEQRRKLFLGVVVIHISASFSLKDWIFSQGLPGLKNVGR